ncbi:EthD family reductase [Saccharopolyspora erythraea]|uniref:EthD domain-containing protein n=1 Tax=Saccharopolyspora erythraea TaxID=1836 RepID=UPI001BA68C16|nr:EthD domain-containing protein [Saccharopolyspora erythraea]QUH01817.1 EthD family reductase [Saccharopolyspora erythraea]
MARSSKPVRTIALFSRKPGMSFAQFDEYWREKHAPLAAQVPGVIRYVQRHIVPQSDQAEPDNGFGIDGFAVLDYESAEAMTAGWASEAGQRALADTENFIGEHHVVVLEDLVVIDHEDNG